MSRAICVVHLGITYLVTCSGCGSKTVVNEVPQAYVSMRALSTAYVLTTDALDRGPKNMTELMPQLKKQGAAAEPLLASNGDEFVIHWGVDYRKYFGKTGGMPVIAYEKSGKSGRRYVLRVRDIEQATDEELANFPFPAGFKAP
jgi:hypothetical protein